MKNRQKPFRHELKFLITYAEKEIIESRLRTVAKLDSHVNQGHYFIRSLYFDDLHESAYETKLAGTASRKKYRVRIYDYSDQVINLECKRKEGSYIQKVSVPISKEELSQLVKGDCLFLRDRQEDLCKEFYYEWITKGMKEAVIVDYDRIPYVYPYGDVRITFDQHIQAAYMSHDIFSKSIPGYDVMDRDCLIMEVKYTEYLPQIIKDVLQVDNSVYLSSSKYVLCMEKKKEFEGILR